MKKLSSLIKKADIYGELFNFTINRELKFKTIFGGLITIFTTIFLIWMTCDFSYLLLSRSLPLIATNIENIKDIKDFNSIKTKNSANFTIAFRLEDHLGNPYENKNIKFLEPVVSLNQNIFDENLKKFSNINTPIKYKACEENEKNFDKNL